MNKLKIYLNEETIVDSLPPERRYSTYPEPGNKTIGHVVSAHPLEAQYQGVWGAVHGSSSLEDGGFYSTHALIKCAAENLYGLSWEDA